jgi:hypothetical protein
LSRITIVFTLGNVTIVGPILLSGAAYAARYVPSLGLISQGNITINPIVTRVDAYLFSNGTIDTCNPGAVAGSTTCATAQLVVNGFLMGKSLAFNRTGKINVGGSQISERIVLTPNIYLNPPKFFDQPMTDTQVPLGEKPPLQ